MRNACAKEDGAKKKAVRIADGPLCFPNLRKVPAFAGIFAAVCPILFGGDLQVILHVRYTLYALHDFFGSGLLFG